MEPHQSGRRPLHPAVKVAIGLVLGAVAVYLVISTAGGIHDAANAVRHMNGWFVVLAVAFACVRMVLFSLQLLGLGRRSGPMGAATAMGFALVMYGFGAITPASPAEGLAIASRELEARGRSKQQAHMTVGFSEWFTQRTFYAISAVDLILVVVLGRFRFTDSWPLMFVALLVFGVLAGTAVLAQRPSSVARVAKLADALRIGRPKPPTGDRMEVASTWHAHAMAIAGPPRRRARLAAVSALAVFADAGTLWATNRSAGFDVKFDIVLLAVAVGTVATWVPFLPGGLGLVEVAIPTILHRFGAPLNAALASTLVYRAAGTLLPALGGGVAIVALRPRRRHDTLTPQPASN